MRKVVSLVLLSILAASTLAIVETASAYVTKPSVPEFTAEYANSSYDVPPVYGVDPYTGDTVVKQAGYHVENRTLNLKIRNQPFTPTSDGSGNYSSIYYNVRLKGYFETQWGHYFYDPENGYQSRHYSPTYNASDSEYTIIPLRLEELSGLSDGGQLDIQVQALAGWARKVYTGSFGFYWTGGDMDHYYQFEGEVSDWSSTQTITIGESTPTTTPTMQPSQPALSPTVTAAPTENPENPTIVPQQPSAQEFVVFGLSWEQIAIAGLCVVVVVLVVVLVFSRRR